MMTTFLFTLTIASSITGKATSTNFCEWLGDSASAIAQNRDNGVGEYDLIGKYLKESESYGEQSVIIPLIDRVYGVQRHISPNDIAIVEQTQCEIALVQHRIKN